MVERCGTAPMLPGYFVARACTLEANSVKDPAQPARLAEMELKANPKQSSSLIEQGALRYRAGAFEEAELLEEQSLQADPRSGVAVAGWLWLALTEQRLGKTEEARRLLDRAAKWLDQGRPDFSHSEIDKQKEGLHLHNWLEAHVLRREAEALLGTPPAAGER
jgi:tetratricopeptide (TPR) repeat protein